MQEYGCKLRPGEREMEVTAFRTILLVGFLCYSSFPIPPFLFFFSYPCPRLVQVKRHLEGQSLAS